MTSKLHMHPLLAEMTEHLRTKHADGARDLAGVIRECGEAGFRPVIIMAGLSEVFLVPHGEAKALVVSHFFRGEERAKLDLLHSQMEEALFDAPKDGAADGGLVQER